MRPIIIGLLLLAATPAWAQQVPETVRRDLWCGLAFAHMANDAPADATAEQKELAARFDAGAQVLIDRARTAYRERGTSEESLNALADSLAADVAAQIDTGAAEPAYSYEECLALLPL